MSCHGCDGEGKNSPQLWKNYVTCHWLAGEEGGSFRVTGERRPDLASRPTRSQKVVGTKKKLVLPAHMDPIGLEGFSPPNPPLFFYHFIPIRN